MGNSKQHAEMGLNTVVLLLYSTAKPVFLINSVQLVCWVKPWRAKWHKRKGNIGQCIKLGSIPGRCPVWNPKSHEASYTRFFQLHDEWMFLRTGFLLLNLVVLGVYVLYCLYILMWNVYVQYRSLIYVTYLQCVILMYWCKLEKVWNWQKETRRWLRKIEYKAISAGEKKNVMPRCNRLSASLFMGHSR